MLGTIEDYNKITKYKTLADIDIGGLIDDSLAGAITMIPLGVNFPPKGLFEIARMPISTIKAQGACLGNLMDIVPDANKPQIADIAGVVRFFSFLLFLFLILLVQGKFTS